MTRIYISTRKQSQDLLKACRAGNLEIVKNFIKFDMESLDDIQNSSLAIQMLIFATMKGHLDICKVIWDTPKLNRYINNVTSLKNLLEKGLTNGHLNTSKFILDKLNEKNVNYNMVISSSLIKSVQNGHLNIVKHFLLDKPFDYLYQTEFKSNSLLNSACGYNQLKILQFLLETDSIKDKYNIHKDNDCLFKLACENEHTDIIKYFIFDYKIENSHYIQDHLKASQNRFEYITKWFELRDLQQSLNQDLINKEVTNKKLKV